MTDQERDQLDARYALMWRWITIFRMLSMDRLAPWLDELGIAPEHGASWRTTGRQFCREYYAYADEHAVGDWRAYDGWPIEVAEAWLRRALDTATQLEGAAAAATLFAWGEGTFVHEPQEPDYSFMWSMLLHNVDPRVPDSQPPLELDEEKRAWLQQTYLRLFERDTSALAELPQSPPQSDWDNMVCRRYWDWMDDPGHITDPLDWALGTIRYRRMRDVWALLKRRFSDEDLEVVLRWAKQTAPQSGWDADVIALPPW